MMPHRIGQVLVKVRGGLPYAKYEDAIFIQERHLNIMRSYACFANGRLAKTPKDYESLDDEEKGYTLHFSSICKLLGEITTTVWMRDRYIHRQYGPAILETLSSGAVWHEAWKINDRFSRHDGPAISVDDPTHEKYMVKIWARDDKYHRLDGPAVEGQRINPIPNFADPVNQIVAFRSWYVNGVQLARFEDENIANDPKAAILSYLKRYPHYRKEILQIAEHNTWLDKNLIHTIESVSDFA